MNKVTVLITEMTSNGYAKRQYDNVVLPFKYGKLLDEQLDYAVFSIQQTTVRKFPLNTTVSVRVSSDGTEFYTCENWLIVSDESVESPVGSGMYNHEIMIIEPTKLAEGIPMESLCFTNPTGNDYTRNAVAPELTVVEN